MTDDAEFSEFDLPPGAARAQQMGRACLAAGGFALLICVGPGSSPFLVTVGSSSARNAIEVRTWTVDLGCLPR